MASVRYVLVLLGVVLLGPALSGCMGSSDETEDWERERAAHGAVGLEATFAGTHTDPLVTGTGTLAEAKSPFVLAPERRLPDDPALTFFDADVEGQGPGVLLLEGTAVTVTEGTLGGAPTRLARGVGPRLALTFAEPLPGAPAAPSGFPASLRAEETLAFFADSIPITGTDLQVESFDRAVFVAGGVATNLSAPVRFDATALHWYAGSALEAGRATIDWERFAWAAPGGDTKVSKAGGDIADPLGVFGLAARLELSATAVGSKGPFRLIQVATDDGFLLDAEVELKPSQRSVSVAQGGETWLKLYHRESGYVGAAVFEDVVTSGPGGPLVSVPIARPPLHIQELWESLEDHPTLAQPFVALAFTLLSPAVLFVDVLEGIACVFAECPHDHPYPVWMEPGEIGTFFVRVQGDAEPGPYEATLRFQGINHGPVSVPITITVTEATGDGHDHMH